MPPRTGARPVVAYVGNFTRPWCTENHVAAALDALGYQVHRLQENELTPDDWRRLPAWAQRRDWQALLWTRTWGAPDQAAALDGLDGLRRLGVPSAFFHLDRWWGLGREPQLRDEAWPRCDVVFTADGGHDAEWDAIGVNHVWLPPGVHGPECTVGRPRPDRWPADVVFVGSHPYPHPEWFDYRHSLLTAMHEHFGSRFQVLPADDRPIRGQALADLYATAKVVVGDSCLAGGATRYWSDRVPETLGRGGVLLHPEVDGLADWYAPGLDLMTYPLGDFGQAVERVEFLLGAPRIRRSMAEQGQATVLGRDTYKHRMRQVMDVLAGWRAGWRPVSA